MKFNFNHNTHFIKFSKHRQNNNLNKTNLTAELTLNLYFVLSERGISSFSNYHILAIIKHNFVYFNLTTTLCFHSLVEKIKHKKKKLNKMCPI